MHYITCTKHNGATRSDAVSKAAERKEFHYSPNTNIQLRITRRVSSKLHLEDIASGNSAEHKIDTDRLFGAINLSATTKLR